MFENVWSHVYDVEWFLFKLYNNNTNTITSNNSYFPRHRKFVLQIWTAASQVVVPAQSIEELIQLPLSFILDVSFASRFIIKLRLKEFSLNKNFFEISFF